MRRRRRELNKDHFAGKKRHHAPAGKAGLSIGQPKDEEGVVVVGRDP